MAGIVIEPKEAFQITVERAGTQGEKGDVGPEGPTGATGAAGADGENGTNGTDGADGNDGWTPVEANVTDGARVVKQIVDWVGGTGTKPATGKYVGPTGLVDDIAEATDIRGASGSGSGDMLSSTYDPNGKASDAFAMDNMVEGTSTKIMTAAERTKLDGIEAGADKTTAAKVGAAIAGTSQVPSPADGDRFAGVLADSSSLFWTTWGNLKAALKGYFDGIYAPTSSLKPVATSGSYNDLDDKPSIPAAPVNADWDATSGLEEIKNKPTLGSAAALDVGTSANKIVQLDGSGKLPALDGSQLTNLPGGTVPAAGAIGSHVIAASTDLVSGNNYPINTTVSGSSLVVCSATPGTGAVFPLSARGVGQLDTISGGSSSLGYSGTWRLLSRVALGASANSNYPMALFVRIA